MPPPPQRYPYLYEGECTRRDDPDGLGRIRIRIPGMVEPETPQWVEPIGGKCGGFAQRGEYDPPPVGANVAVMFVLGDPDEPRYLVGPWGDPGGVSDVPTGAALGSPPEQDDRQASVVEDGEWLITRDSRTALSGVSPKLELKHKSSGMYLLFDANPTALRVRLDSGAGPALELRVTGQEITLDTGVGPSLVLNGAAGQAYLQAGSSPEIGLSGTDTFLGVRTATKKAMLGDDYRTDEAAYINTLVAALQTFVSALTGAVDPVVSAAATTFNGVLTAPPISTSPYRTDAAHTGYLSQNVKVQD